jgi:hypothetical protein
VDNEFCCDKFKLEFDSGRIERANGMFDVPGCCGGCTMLDEIKYCPFCGSWGASKREIAQ